MRTIAWSVLLALPLFEQNAPIGMNFYSLGREAQLGRQTAAHLSAILPMVSDAKLDAYISTLATSLHHNGDGRFSYSFSIYDDRKPLTVDRIPLAMPPDAFYGPAREPIAVAGGPVFVPLGLLAGAENEAEFAFLVSHAMAHIAMRHSTRQATRLELSGMAVRALPNAVPAAVRSASDQAQQSRAIEMASAAEVEADRAAIDTMVAAGYDPSRRTLSTALPCGQRREIESRERRHRNTAVAYLFRQYRPVRSRKNSSR